MPTTTHMGFRYPQLTDAPNVPQDVQNLASDVDTAVYNLKSQIGCRLTQGTAQTGWTTGTYNSLTFGTEDFDYGTLHDVSTNPSRITIGGHLGLWEITGMYCAAVNGNCTNHRVHLTLNGTAVNGALTSIAVSTTGFVCIPLPPTFVLATTSTDYVELQGYMVAASGTIGTAVSTEARSSFQAIYRGTQ